MCFQVDPTFSGEKVVIAGWGHTRQVMIVEVAITHSPDHSRRTFDEVSGHETKDGSKQKEEGKEEC